MNTSHCYDLIEPARKGNATLLASLISFGSGSDCGTHNANQALQWAASAGHAECVKLLIPVSDPKAKDSFALYWAARLGHTECVKLLIPVSDPKANESAALRMAAAYGHSECVQVLIPVSDPKAQNSFALGWAAVHGHAQCVALLIGVSDPKANESAALHMAVVNGHDDCVDLLWDVSDACGVVAVLKDRHPEKQHIWSEWEQHMVAKRQAAALHKAVDTIEHFPFHRTRKL